MSSVPLENDRLLMICDTADVVCLNAQLYTPNDVQLARAELAEGGWQTIAIPDSGDSFKIRDLCKAHRIDNLSQDRGSITLGAKRPKSPRARKPKTEG